MPVIGPTQQLAKYMAKIIAPKLYLLIKEDVKNQGTTYRNRYNARLALNEFYKNRKTNTTDDLNNYNYNRYLYLLIGFLLAKLPNKEFTGVNGYGVKWSKLGMDPEYFNFSEKQLEEWLVDLFFFVDMEDF